MVDVRGEAEYLSDGRIRVTLSGTDTELSAVAATTGDVARVARDLARQAGLTFSGALLVAPPAWLTVGQVVRLSGAGLDEADDPSHPFGQVVGFLAVGGVEVVHPEQGMGICPPEDCRPVDLAQLPAGLLEELVAYTGVPVAG